MLRQPVLILLVCLLPACASVPQWASQGSPLTRRPASPSQFSFNWQLSGDRAVAPLQVFDDGRRTWLQFAPGQPVPAIFEVTPAGDRPLPYRVEGPYVVLQGVWPQLALRGGHLQSRVQRIVPVQAQYTQSTQPRVPAPIDSYPSTLPAQKGVAAVSAPAGPSAAVHAYPSANSSINSSANTSASTSANSPATTAVVASVGMPPVAPVVDPGVADSAVKVQAIPSSAQSAQKETGQNLASSLTAKSFSVTSPSTGAYRVSPQDVTIRQALGRWARQAGWTFEPEHWAVDVDIPISGSAVFETDFKQAVRQLVAATELADRPLQPCFYSNQVLRIVPFAQACDRGLSARGAS